jgi:3-deoxy-7-phosphoheptulonate synthase
MMVVMTPQATEAEITAVVEKLEARGVHAKVMPGELTTAIGAIGDPEGVRDMGLEGMPGVDQVIPISRPYKLASSELSHSQPTTFEVDGRRVGGGQTFCLIAGPCTVESREQTLAVADAVRLPGPRARCARHPQRGARGHRPPGRHGADRRRERAGAR